MLMRGTSVHICVLAVCTPVYSSPLIFLVLPHYVKLLVYPQPSVDNHDGQALQENSLLNGEETASLKPRF